MKLEANKKKILRLLNHCNVGFICCFNLAYPTLNNALADSLKRVKIQGYTQSEKLFTTLVHFPRRLD